MIFRVLTVREQRGRDGKSHHPNTDRTYEEADVSDRFVIRSIDRECIIWKG